MKTLKNCLRVSAILIASALNACGGHSDDTPSHPSQHDPNDPPDAQTIDGPVPDGGSGPAADCSPDSTDDPDPGGVDSNCDLADGTVGKDVYVAGASGQNTNEGSPSAPLRTLDAALKLAASRGGRVLVADGEYSLTELDQAGDWQLYGGYSADFKGSRANQRTVLKAADAHGVMIRGASSVRIEQVTVQGVAGTEDVPSSHALRLDVEKAILDQVIVASDDGWSGPLQMQAGAPGAPGRSPDSPYGARDLFCNGVIQSSIANGATPDSPNAAGASPGIQASLSAPGVALTGKRGTDGLDAPKEPELASALLVWNPGQNAKDNAGPGYGGPGGGSSEPNNWFYANLRGGGGGTGGCPGGPGLGGTSGGGSVAILVLRGTVTLTNAIVRTGIGGNGSGGGEGGAGGPGAIGGKPFCSNQSYCGTPTPPDDCRAATLPMSCANYGGNGGQGGQGGHGGGGAGGWTIGVVTVTGATANVDGSVTFDLGQPGNGGEGNGGRAPDGERRRGYVIGK